MAITVSTGLISGLKRRIVMPSGETLTNLIQHTACINPGDSGGPLLNINGELIGINVALRDGAQAISFALNADSVKAALSKHLSAAKVARVRHGLTCSEVVQGRGADRQKVVVEEVVSSSAAARAGLKKGDVLVKVGQRAVSNRFDVERALYGCKPGDKVVAAVVRDGKATTVSFTLSGAAPPRVTSTQVRAAPDPLKEAEEALKALRQAKDNEKKRQAAEALDRATRKLREQLKR
jgi:serine protease Do